MEQLTAPRGRRIIAEMLAGRETDPPAGFVQLQVGPAERSDDRRAHDGQSPGEGCRGAAAPEPRAISSNRGVSLAGIAAREGLTAKRSRPEMAPQRLEKIESAPGNGRASETPNPQDVVHGRAAVRDSG